MKQEKILAPNPARIKGELAYLEQELGNFGPQWNLFGQIDRMKQAVKNIQRELDQVTSTDKLI